LRDNKVARSQQRARSQPSERDKKQLARVEKNGAHEKNVVLAAKGVHRNPKGGSPPDTLQFANKTDDAVLKMS